MIKLLKDLFNWCLDVEGIRTTEVVKTSITGQPLVIFDSGSAMRGWSLRQTKECMNGALIINCIELNFHLSKMNAIAVLSGKYDYCITQDLKDRVIKVVQGIIDQQGRYSSYARTRAGLYETETFQLTKDEIEMFTELLRV